MAGECKKLCTLRKQMQHCIGARQKEKSALCFDVAPLVSASCIFFTFTIRNSLRVIVVNVAADDDDDASVSFVLAFESLFSFVAAHHCHRQHHYSLSLYSIFCIFTRFYAIAQCAIIVGF